MAKSAANDALNDADKIVKVWTDNPTFTMGDVTLLSFKAEMKGVTDADQAVEDERHQLTALINARDAQIAKVAELTTRARSGIRSAFGPDSSQYEQAGGKRKSERKKPVRKPKANKA